MKPLLCQCCIYHVFTSRSPSKADRGVILAVEARLRIVLALAVVGQLRTQKSRSLEDCDGCGAVCKRRLLTPSLPSPSLYNFRAERCREGTPLQTVFSGRPYKQCLFRSYETSTFNTMHFDQIPFTHQCEKEDKQTEGFQILHLYWSFSSGVVAVKWLKAWSG